MYFSSLLFFKLVCNVIGLNVRTYYLLKIRLPLSGHVISSNPSLPSNFIHRISMCFPWSRSGMMNWIGFYGVDSENSSNFG